MFVHDRNDAFISKSIIEDGIWEEQETSILLALLKPGHVFVDVGANLGYFSLIASLLVAEQGSVVAFEPEAENFRLLKMNCELNELANVHCVNAALGHENAEGSLFLSESNMGDHSISPGDERQQRQDIAIVNGSELLLNLQNRVDVIKIDTQGYEYEVLLGLQEVIEASIPDLTIIIEFSPIHLRNTETSGTALLDLLQKVGLCCFYVPDPGSPGLLAISDYELRALSSLADKDPDSEGFTNLVVSGKPLDGRSDLTVVSDLGMFENTLSYMIMGEVLQSWDGTQCGVINSGKYFYFPQGWYFAERWGRWSIGSHSRLKFYPGKNIGEFSRAELQVTGRYFGEPELTRVLVNDVHVGDFDLRDAQIPIPVALLQTTFVELGFVYSSPNEPDPDDEASEQRAIKFGLETIAISAGGADEA